MWLKKGLDKNPNDASLWLALGRWYARQQRVPEAKSALVTALQNETRADLLQEIARAITELPTR
jgi:cytochrome c-type biogenesis protein CcmH/NrfG